MSFQFIETTDYSLKSNLLFAGPQEEEDRQEHGQDQVRGEIQERQVQMVLPEAQILSC